MTPKTNTSQNSSTSAITNRFLLPRPNGNKKKLEAGANDLGDVIQRMEICCNKAPSIPPDKIAVEKKLETPEKVHWEPPSGQNSAQEYQIRRD